MTFNAKMQRRKDAKRIRNFCLSAPLRLCASALILWIITTISPAGAQEPKSLDQQLLDDLNDDLLKDLPSPGKPPADADANPNAAVQPTSDNPLAQIAERMRAAQERIARRDTSEPTQKLQRQIQDDLAALIEEAKKQCAACNKSSSGQGGLIGGNPVPAPPRDSTDRIERGSKETVETADVHDLLRRFWGHLPEKMREQMQSSLGEQFLPKYERLIEDYYLRLAEDPRARP